MRPEVAVFGDFHSGDTDPIVKEALKEIVEFTKPKIIILHDVFDGKAINHHEKRKNVKRALLYRNHKLSLEDELRKLAEDLNELSTWADKLIIIKSNHDEFLEEILEDGRYIYDPINSRICSQLYVAMVDGHDPLKYGVELLGLTAKNIKWLERDESYEVAGIELGAHGDKGPNGSRGSIKSLEASYGSCVIGHCLTDDHSVNTIGRGWVKLSEVKKGDTVLSYDYKNKKNVWAMVTGTTAIDYTGMILSVGHRLWRQDMTSNHCMFTEDGEYIPICDAIKNVPLYKIPIMSDNPADNRPLSTDLITDLDLMRVLVAVCADGSFDKFGNLTFHLKKQRKIDRLNNLALKFDYIISWGLETKDGSRKCSIFKSSDLYNKIIEYVNPSNKQLPDLFRWQSIDFKEEFVRELQYWDGTYKPNKNGQQFSTSKEIEVNLVQSILTELGYRTTLYRRFFGGATNNRGYVLGFNLDKIRSIVSEKHNGSTIYWKVVPTQVENVPVFCLTTLYSNFWVRHDITGEVSLTGNTHTPGILRGTFQVGTSSYLRLNYNVGPSSWMHTMCLVYPNGQRQLINIVNGAWHLDDNK